MSEVVAGGELPKGSYEEVVIFRRTRGATVDHTEKERIGPAQRDLKPQCITKRCRSGIREDNRDWQSRILQFQLTSDNELSPDDRRSPSSKSVDGDKEHAAKPANILVQRYEDIIGQTLTVFRHLRQWPDKQFRQAPTMRFTAIFEQCGWEVIRTMNSVALGMMYAVIKLRGRRGFQHAKHRLSSAVMYTEAKDHLAVTSYSLGHNHKLSRFLYDRLPVNHRQTKDELGTCRALLKYGTSLCEVRQLVTDGFGRLLTTRDMYDYRRKCRPALVNRYRLYTFLITDGMGIGRPVMYAFVEIEQFAPMRKLFGLFKEMMGEDHPVRTFIMDKLVAQMRAARVVFGCDVMPFAIFMSEKLSGSTYVSFNIHVFLVKDTLQTAGKYSAAWLTWTTPCNSHRLDEEGANDYGTLHVQTGSSVTPRTKPYQFTVFSSFSSSSPLLKVWKISELCEFIGTVFRLLFSLEQDRHSFAGCCDILAVAWRFQ
ncbi:hypothetical protein CLF_110364, partial [Clonorchis sinensis]